MCLIHESVLNIQTAYQLSEIDILSDCVTCFVALFKSVAVVGEYGVVCMTLVHLFLLLLALTLR